MQKRIETYFIIAYTVIKVSYLRILSAKSSVSMYEFTPLIQTLISDPTCGLMPSNYYQWFILYSIIIAS